MSSGQLGIGPDMGAHGWVVTTVRHVMGREAWKTAGQGAASNVKE